jgi:hypothetical protein
MSSIAIVRTILGILAGVAFALAGLAILFWLVAPRNN